MSQGQSANERQSGKASNSQRTAVVGWAHNGTQMHSARHVELCQFHGPGDAVSMSNAGQWMNTICGAPSSLPNVSTATKSCHMKALGRGVALCALCARCADSAPQGTHCTVLRYLPHALYARLWQNNAKEGVECTLVHRLPTDCRLPVHATGLHSAAAKRMAAVASEQGCCEALTTQHSK